MFCHSESRYVNLWLEIRSTWLWNTPSIIIENIWKMQRIQSDSEAD
jgi:hypothetical protein